MEMKLKLVSNKVHKLLKKHLMKQRNMDIE